MFLYCIFSCVGENLFRSLGNPNSFSNGAENDSILSELTTWLIRHDDVTPAIFAERVLYTNLEMLNSIFQRKNRSPEYMRIIRNFLSDSKQQEQLLLYVKSKLISSKCVQDHLNITVYTLLYLS